MHSLHHAHTDIREDHRGDTARCGQRAFGRVPGAVRAHEHCVVRSGPAGVRVGRRHLQAAEQMGAAHAHLAHVPRRQPRVGGDGRQADHGVGRDAVPPRAGAGSAQGAHLQRHVARLARVD